MLNILPSSQAAPRARQRAVMGFVVALVAMTLTPRSGNAQIAVVVNSANSVDELSIDKLRRLFLGQAATFPSGQHARLATHSGSAAAFDRTALDLAPEIVRSRWMAIVFRGEATGVPAALASTDDVKKFVQDHPDAIAYLPLAAVDASLKVLRIDGRRPNDPGYPIR